MRTKRNLGYLDVTTLNLMCERFYLIQGEQTIDSIKHRVRTWDKTFYELYKNPSQTKQEIYSYWEKYFHSLGIYDITCQGSPMLFSIRAYDETTGNIYHITKCYNRLYVPRAVQTTHIEK